MEWLEAMLAFAAVMMIFATFVSAIIELLHRVTQIREDGLQSMMIQVYQKILIPGFSRNDQAPGSSQEEFVNLMTQTRLLPLPPDARLLRKFVYKAVNARRLMNLPTEKFLQRFIESKDGQQLIREAADQGRSNALEILKSIARNYEDFGDSARDFFTRRSRLLSALIAVMLAFSINLDALELFKTFLADKGMRQAMIERGNSVAVEIQQIERKLLDSTNRGNKGNAEIRKEIAAKTEDFQASLADLKASGVPIGWERAPWHTKAFKTEVDTISRTTMIVGWFFSVLLGGLHSGVPPNASPSPPGGLAGEAANPARYTGLSSPRPSRPGCLCWPMLLGK